MRHPTLWLAVFLLSQATAAQAQHLPPPGSGATPNSIAPDSTVQGTMSPGDIKEFADFVDNARRLEAKDLVSKSLAIRRSTVMLDALHVSCRVSNAAHIGSGSIVVDGKSESAGLYEVACEDGMGYLLTLIGRSSATGISCFAAAAFAADDRASRAPVDTRCRLPENQDFGAMASKGLRQAGIDCEAREQKWLGQSADPKVDFIEVACRDGRGFVLRSPVPGSKSAADALSCAEAARHGANCILTAAAAPASAANSTDNASTAQIRPDLQWFKDALSARGVPCDVQKARIIGRESIKRRYIVEYLCPQQPRGIVAYVPSAGDSVNPFESMDCDAAAIRKITCQFARIH
jgi:hypothetical protein